MPAVVSTRLVFAPSDNDPPVDSRSEVEPSSANRSVPPADPKTSWLIEPEKVPRSSVPTVVASPSVTVEFDGIALFTP